MDKIFRFENYFSLALKGNNFLNFAENGEFFHPSGLGKKKNSIFVDYPNSHHRILKNYFLTCFTFMFLLVGCTEKKPSRTEMVKQYYEAFDMSDFNTMRTLLNDSISITSGDYVTTYSHTSFYEFFKWDSVLRTRKKLLNVESSDNDILATVSYSSMRYEFLKNNHLTCQYKINFKEDKISSFEELDCPNADWQVWEKQVNSLVEWTKTHHPELDGFIYDLTMQGALNYLKAMELYKNREIDL